MQDYSIFVSRIIDWSIALCTWLPI